MYRLAPARGLTSLLPTALLLLAGCADRMQTVTAPGAIRAVAIPYESVCFETGENVQSKPPEEDQLPYEYWHGPSPTGCGSAEQFGFDDQTTRWGIDLSAAVRAKVGSWDNQIAGSAHNVWATYEYRLPDPNESPTLPREIRFVSAVFEGWDGSARAIHVPEFDSFLLSPLAGVKFVSYLGGCETSVTDPEACWAKARQNNHYHWEFRYCVDDNEETVFGNAKTMNGECVYQVDLENPPANVGPRAAFGATSSPVTSGSANGTITGDASASCDRVDGIGVVTLQCNVPEGDRSLTYTWHLINASGTLVETHYGKATTFSGLLAGVYRLRLTVRDGQGGFDIAEQTVTVASAPANRAPVAVATVTTVQQPTKKFGSFTVSGADSYDLDNDPLTYKWVVRDSANFAFDSASTVGATFIASPGLYTATLTVSDGRGASSSASVTVRINKPIPGISISGPETVQPYSSCTWTASVSAVTEPYTTRWYVSSGGGPFFQADSGSSYTHYAYPGSLIIRARAIRGDGTVISSADKPITVATSAPGC
jgi:hypothetical protein